MSSIQVASVQDVLLISYISGFQRMGTLLAKFKTNSTGFHVSIVLIEGEGSDFRIRQLPLNHQNKASGYGE